MLSKGTLAFAGGVIVLQHMPVLPPVWLAAGLPICLIALVFCKRLTLCLILCALIGFLWAQFQAQQLLAQRIPAQLIKQDIEVIGRIAGLPEPFERGVRFEFAVEACAAVLTRCPQRIRLSWYQASDIALLPGQHWRFSVRLKPPREFANPGAFDYSGWLLQKGIVATGYINSRAPYALLGQDRRHFPVQQMRYQLQQFLLQHFAGSAAEPMVRALLIGDRSGMQDTQWEVLQRTGTVHLMAISGLHVGLIAGFSFLLMRGLWRRSTALCLHLAAPRAAALFAWVMAAGYAALAGFAIPTQRALIMLAVVMLAIFLQRPTRPRHVLCLALLIILVADPFAVLAAGFWLSFAAVALIYYLVTVQANRTGRLQRWTRMQLAISLGMLPLVVLYFQQAPIISPLANLLAIPWVSLLVVPLAMGSLMLSGLQSAWGIAGLQFAITLQDWLYRILAWVAAWPFSNVYLPAPGMMVLLLALAGVGLMLLPRRFPARYLGLFLCLPLLLPTQERPPHGEVVVTLLDVGQGLATVVMTQNHVLVFDTGPAFSERFDTGEAVLLPYLRSRAVRAIDMLIVSHGDNDHLGGAASLVASMPVHATLSSVPEKLGMNARFCMQGMHWVWDGVRFEVLYPLAGQVKNRRNNDQSCVVRITARHQAFLFSGDIEAGVEHALVQHYAKALHSEVLIVPHHGSKTSSSELFLDHVQPQLALFPVGWLNRYRHPHPQVLERYVRRGIRRYDTAQHGAITVHSGETLQVQSYRQTARRYWHVP